MVPHHACGACHAGMNTLLWVIWWVISLHQVNYPDFFMVVAC